jgi:hypothetical protein
LTGRARRGGVAGAAARTERDVSLPAPSLLRNVHLPGARACGLRVRVSVAQGLRQQTVATAQARGHVEPPCGHIRGQCEVAAFQTLEAEEAAG